MCHGQLIGHAIVAARRAFRCTVCARMIPLGEEHVRHVLEVYGEERKNGESRTEPVRMHRRCAARWDLLNAELMDDVCYVGDPVRELREIVQRSGWKAWRGAMRQAARRFLRRGGGA